MGSVHLGTRGEVDQIEFGIQTVLAQTPTGFTLLYSYFLNLIGNFQKKTFTPSIFSYNFLFHRETSLDFFSQQYKFI